MFIKSKITEICGMVDVSCEDFACTGRIYD